MLFTLKCDIFILKCNNFGGIYMEIPAFLDRDDYLQNPIMRKFLKNRGLKFQTTRADYINAIKQYADTDEKCEKDVRQWLLKVAKEGSKDFCYKRIKRITSEQCDPIIIEEKIKRKYPNCPMLNILEYKNTHNRELIEYNIIKDDSGAAIKLEFTYSKLMLCGEVNQEGINTVFPVFIEVYLDNGLIVSRAKAKSTIFRHDGDSNKLLLENKVNAMEYAVAAIYDVIGMLGYDVEQDSKIVKKENYEMFYRIYSQFSFTPEEVVRKVERMRQYNKQYIDLIFEDLKLDVRNKQKALEDMDTIVEKYISIDGRNEDIFKKDRDAYLIKVGSDNELELTKIYTLSQRMVPLQCTSAFFDSKNAIIRSKQCTKLNLVYKRKDDTYLKNKPIVVQFGTTKNFGFFKTLQYAEEEDIQYVLQTIYTNY